MGNSIKKHLSPKSVPPPATKVTKLSNPSTVLTSAATPAPTKSNLLLVCDDEFMKKDALDLISSMTVNKEIDGHSITSYDLMNDIYMFYGGRGGYRPLRRTVGGKLSALIVCIDNTLKTRIPNLDTVRTALHYMNDGETIPLLIIGMSPNEASKAAKLKEQKKIAKANKKTQSVMKSLKQKFNKTNNDNASTIIEETPMDSNEIESLLNESLGLQSNALFSSFHIISLISNKDNTNKDNNNQLMAEGIEWLKKTLKKGSVDETSSNDPPAVVKEDTAAKTMPLIVAPGTEVHVTTNIHDSAHIIAASA